MIGPITSPRSSGVTLLISGPPSSSQRTARSGSLDDARPKCVGDQVPEVELGCAQSVGDSTGPVVLEEEAVEVVEVRRS